MYKSNVIDDGQLQNVLHLYNSRNILLSRYVDTYVLRYRLLIG